MNDQLFNLMGLAADGKSVLIVGKSLRPRTIPVGRGMIHFRGYDHPGLKSINVDIVWFVDFPPCKVETLCRERTRISLNPTFLWGKDLIAE